MKLIIAEKPSAAERIGRSICSSRVEERRRGKVRYYEFEEDGEQVVIAPCAGHLFGLTTERSGYPILFARYEPINEIEEDADYLSGYIELISDMGENADEFISAADYDTEGAVIAYNALRFCLNNEAAESAKRMKFSSLMADELRTAYQNLSDSLDWGMIHAGLARAYMDFIWGLTTSRALTRSLKRAGENGTLSAGRVQTPTLDMLAEREMDIQDFDPEPYWVVRNWFEVNGRKFSVSTDKFWKKGKAEKIAEKYRGEVAKVVSIEGKSRKRYPPPPFNLSDLQSEASSKLDYSPAETQSVAQKLYDKALISYPRTSSQKLPPSLDFRKSVRRLKENSTLKPAAELILSRDSLNPNEGKEDDPAHPCIYPIKAPRVNLEEKMWNVYELIARRFLATFGDPAKILTRKIGLSIASDEFEVRGKQYLKDGWIEIYGKFSSKEESILPDFEEGMEVKLEKVETLDRQTKPPRRHTKSSIIKAMEKKKIGTKATRAPTVKKLKDRGYIESGRRIKVTDLGLVVAKSLRTHVSELTSEKLTRKFEDKMEKIREGKRDHFKVVNEARNELKDISEDFRKYESKIGETLAKARKKLKKTSKEKALGTCPECGRGKIVIKKSGKGKKFAGCDRYPNCDVSYATPQKHFKILKSRCDDCGLRLLSLKGKYGRFHLCPKCGAVK